MLRSTASLLTAATDVVSLGNSDNRTVAMKRGDFRFFKIPQPLKKGQGVMVSVCDTQVVAEATTEAPFTGPVDRRLDEQQEQHRRTLQPVRDILL